MKITRILLLTVSLLAVLTSCNNNDDATIQSSLEGQWFVAGHIRKTDTSVYSTFVSCNESDPMYVLPPTTLRFDKNGVATFSMSSPHVTGSEFPWQDGDYPYEMKNMADEYPLKIGDNKCKISYRESEDAIYIEPYVSDGGIDSNPYHIYIFKRDSKANRNVSFAQRDSNINLMKKEELPNWIVEKIEAHEKEQIALNEKIGRPYSILKPTAPYEKWWSNVHRFKLRGTTYYDICWDIMTFMQAYTADGELLMTEDGNLKYVNRYDIYYNSTDWELIYMFDKVVGKNE
jgi:hypothetical protein